MLEPDDMPVDTGAAMPIMMWIVAGARSSG